MNSDILEIDTIDTNDTIYTIDIEMLDTYSETGILKEISCCVCFTEISTCESNVQTLTDISKENITFDTIIKSACGIHYICIRCLHTIVTDYINHPINEHNSHVYCPYPFEDCLTPAGTKNSFEHQSIIKILDEFEEQNFITHSERFAFPGFTVITCPCTYYTPHSLSTPCKFPVLIENEYITSSDIGDLIIQCHQNEKCCKTFCYHCRQETNNYDRDCRTCKLTSENANPNLLNRYIIKDTSIDNIIYNDEEFDQTKYFDEDNYLYYNKEITIELALEYITNLIEHNVYCICPICKIHLHKTEKCNGMRHHNVERCYACGRTGTRTGGLHNGHWNTDGITGCFRFDYDRFVHKYIPEYKCNQNCQNHENGDCTLDEHQSGIQKLNKIRQKAIIYHCIKSLLPNIRYDLIDMIHDKYLNTPTAYELLPYKQTFIFLEDYQEIMLDYSEESLYEHLNIQHPQTIHEFINKDFIIEPSIYINKFALPQRDSEIFIDMPNSPPDVNLPPIPPPRIIFPLNNTFPLIHTPRNTILEIENLIDRLIREETQPLLENFEIDINELLNSYLPLESDTNTDADYTNTDADYTNTDADYTNTDADYTNTDADLTEYNDTQYDIDDNIRIFSITDDVYILGDSDTELDSDENTDL
jgi:hypothetical protein